MPIQHCENYQFNEPVDAAGVSVTPSGSNFGNSSWVTVFTADADCVLTGIAMFSPGQTSPDTTRFEIDVGISGSVIATHGGYVSSFGTNPTGFGHLPFRIPIDAIPNGSTVQVRMRKNSTNTNTWEFALLFYKKPIVGNILTTAQPQLISAMDPIAAPTAGGSPWTNGSWADILTASSDIVISGYIHGISSNGINYIFDLGISGSVIWTIKDRNGLVGYPLFKMLRHPLQVASGSTVQGRWRNSTWTAGTLPVALTYYELPL
jgi:hypothetical protein